jgi:electron transport complex protein RnfG
MSTHASETAEPNNNLQNNFILQAWLVLLLAMIFGGSLAGIQQKLGPVIEENKINETREKVPELILDAAQMEQLAQNNQSLAITPHSVGVGNGKQKTYYSVYEAKFPDGRPAGWVAKAKGQGYADKIELLFGLNPSAEKITGIFVLEQKETPGLGNKIIEKKWRSQFINKGVTPPLAAVKTGAQAAHEVDAITGATISSVAVCDIINQAAGDLKAPLAAGKL